MKQAKPKMTKCGSILHYEQFSGMRVYTTDKGKRLYRYVCSACKDTGTNNGKPRTCSRPRPVTPKLSVPKRKS